MYNLQSKQLAYLSLGNFCPVSCQGLMPDSPPGIFIMPVSLSLWAPILAFVYLPFATCHMPYAMCHFDPIEHLVALFAVMFRARVHPNDQEFIPTIKSSSHRSRVHPVDADLRTVTVPVTVFMTALHLIIMIP